MREPLQQLLRSCGDTHLEIPKHRVQRVAHAAGPGDDILPQEEAAEATQTGRKVRAQVGGQPLREQRLQRARAPLEPRELRAVREPGRRQR